MNYSINQLIEQLLSNKKLFLINAKSLLVNCIKAKLLIGVELEFYLFANNNQSVKNYLITLAEQPFVKMVMIDKIEPESGPNQYEIKLKPHSNPSLIASNIVKLKKIMNNLAKKQRIIISFDPKPLANEPGCGMHIHCCLVDNQQNLFARSNDLTKLSLIEAAIGGLCSLMSESIIVFTHNNSSFDRFGDSREVANTISWGINNRTTAIRIPISGDSNRRIEYRLASASSDPYLTIAIIIFGIYYGISNNITPPKKIFGIASDKQYGLPTFASNIKQAWLDFNNSLIVKPFIEQRWRSSNIYRKD